MSIMTWEAAKLCLLNPYTYIVSSFINIRERQDSSMFLEVKVQKCADIVQQRSSVHCQYGKVQRYAARLQAYVHLNAM
jgi:hypothetical protein